MAGVKGSGDKEVDAFSGSGFNGCVQTGAAPYLHTLDFVAAMMRELNKQDPGHQWLGKPLTWLGIFHCRAQPQHWEA